MKIKSITKSELTNPKKFYDITVEKYHNFSITDSNIIVHNSAISNTILKMCRKFQSAEPILIGDGFFGSVISHHGAAARYTRVKINPKVSSLLDEFSHLNERNAEGLIESLSIKFPIGLLGMSLGIAVGFATKILPRKFEEIDKFLNGKKANLKPYFCEFDGDVENFNNKQNIWLFKGKCEFTEKSIIYKSIPPFMNFPAFLKKINSIVNKIGVDKVEVFNRCNDLVDFEIKFENIDDFSGLRETLIKANQMIFTENIVLISNKKVIEYQSIEDYLTQYRTKNKILFFNELEYRLNSTQGLLKDTISIIEFMKFMLGAKRKDDEISNFYSKYDKHTKSIFDSIKLRNLNLEYVKKLEKEVVNYKSKIEELKVSIESYELPENFKFTSTKKLDIGGVVFGGEIEEFEFDKVDNNEEVEDDSEEI